MQEKFSFRMACCQVVLITSLAGMSASCNRPSCENKNPIFEEFTMDDREYKNELYNLLKSYGQELSYWFDSYTEANGKEYIIVNVQSTSVCAKAQVLVKDWKKLQDLRDNKGRGYAGAELQEFRMEYNPETGEFIYIDLTDIVD